MDVSGSHAASLAAVASGHADVAALDTVTLALVGRLDPDLRLSTALIQA